ncbi:uncharacterized protein LOC143184638 [Calliopsis andreniformis]|uniref:uncharacterized protein LOC143184638 n=1 Tax=Calliopsis andreniformis TaxID=337506 RepID=UPI003FCD6251
MLTISQRRRHPRWRMFFIVVILSVLVRHCEQTSTKRLTDSGSSSSAPTLPRSSSETRTQNLGSSSDLNWQAWFLFDTPTRSHSGMDSGNIFRRITPKSVFIAPALPALPPCAEGYRADTMGRCIKNVNIDQDAHIGFLLQRLNDRYGNRGGNSEPSNSHKKSSGPFQLNIPLLSRLDTQSSKVDHEETEDSIKVPIVVPPREEISSTETTEPPELTTRQTTYSSEEETTVLPTSNTPPSEDDESTPSSQLDTVVPVAEFVDNGTSFSDVVDYKIPIDLKTLLNISDVRTINASDDLEAWEDGSQLYNSTEASPMLILLTSAATLPNSIVPEEEDLDNSTTHRADVWADNVTTNVTDKEIISTDVPESAPPNKVLDVLYSQ